MASRRTRRPKGRRSTPDSSTGIGGRRARVWTAGTLIWLILPVVGLALIVARSSGQQIEPEVAVWAPVQVTEERTTSAVGLAYDWAPAQTVRAPQWNGIVQEARCAPQSTIESGAIVARVDNVHRVAFHSTIPFVRELTFGAEGDDVAQLHELLEAQGIDSPGGESFTRGTGIAVGELADRLGLTDAVRTFEPGWVLYLPAPVIEVADCLLEVGAPVPAFGEPVITSAPQLTRAVVVTPALVESLLTAAQPVEDSEDNVSAASSVEEDDRVPFQAGDTLAVAGNEIQVDPDTGEAVSESLPQLEALVQSLTPATSAVHSVPAPPNSWVVPTDAVFAANSGETCVVTRGGEEPVPVTIVGYDASGTIVRGGLEARTRVLVAPGPDQRPCG